MNFALQILRLALALVSARSRGALQRDAFVAQTLLKIIQVAAQAHYEYTGKPIDPTIIKAEAGI